MQPEVCFFHLWILGLCARKEKALAAQVSVPKDSERSDHVANGMAEAPENEASVEITIKSADPLNEGDLPFFYNKKPHKILSAVILKLLFMGVCMSFDFLAKLVSSVRT